MLISKIPQTMKTKKIFYTVLMIALPFVWTSCSDLLDVEPEDQITKENFYQTEADFQAATGPLYNRVWFDFNDKFYYGLGDGRSNNLYAPYSDYVYPFTDLSETGLTIFIILKFFFFLKISKASSSKSGAITISRKVLFNSSAVAASTL